MADQPPPRVRVLCASIATFALNSVGRQAPLFFTATVSLVNFLSPTNPKISELPECAP
jgi:hypothetical protein